MSDRMPPPPSPQDRMADAAVERPRFPKFFESVGFGLSMMMAIPLRLAAVAGFGAAVPFLVDYWISLQPPYDDSSGVVPPNPDEILGLLIRFVAFAFVITLAYRVVLDFYDSRRTTDAFDRTDLVQEPVRIVLSGWLRNAGWLLVFGLAFAITIWRVADSTWLRYLLIQFGVALVSTKFGFVFVAAADGRKSSLRRSFQVALTYRFFDVLVTNMVLLVFMNVIIRTRFSWIDSADHSAWFNYAASVARSFAVIGIVGGATTFMYRAAFPPGSVSPPVPRRDR